MEADPKIAEQKFNEFLRLLPLTLAVAGLPLAPPGTYMTDGQLDARATAIRSAYKISRQLILDIIK